MDSLWFGRNTDCPAGGTHHASVPYKFLWQHDGRHGSRLHPPGTRLHLKGYAFAFRPIAPFSSFVAEALIADINTDVKVALNCLQREAYVAFANDEFFAGSEPPPKTDAETAANK